CRAIHGVLRFFLVPEAARTGQKSCVLRKKFLSLFFISCMKKLSASKLGLLSGPLSFVLIFFFAQPDDLSPEGVAMMAATSWVAIWWISEAVPIAATSLLPLVLFPLLGIMGIKDTSVAYADPM